VSVYRAGCKEYFDIDEEVYQALLVVWLGWWLVVRRSSRLEVAVNSEIERQRGLAWYQYIEQVARSILI